MSELDRREQMQRELFLSVLMPTKPSVAMARKMARSMQELRAPQGYVLYEKGDVADSSFFITEGTVVLDDDGADPLTFTVGDIVGVVDLNMDRPRSRRAQATTDVVLLQLAYEVWTQAFATERALVLLEAGANTQRPLWASTGVKDPSVPDTTYVVGPAAPSVVNTMPEKTLDALADHGVVEGDTIAGSYAEANKVLDAIGALGISYAEVTELLEKEGVEKFIISWNELLETVTAALKAGE